MEPREQADSLGLQDQQEAQDPVVPLVRLVSRDQKGTLDQQEDQVLQDLKVQRDHQGDLGQVVLLGPQGLQDPSETSDPRGPLVPKAVKVLQGFQDQQEDKDYREDQDQRVPGDL
jgi:hypothetical protein